MTLNRPIVPIITFQSFTDNQVEDFVLTRIWNLESGSVSDPGPGLRDWVTLAWSRRDTDERAPSCPDSAEFYRTQSCSTSHRPGNGKWSVKIRAKPSKCQETLPWMRGTGLCPSPSWPGHSGCRGPLPRAGCPDDMDFVLQFLLRGTLLKYFEWQWHGGMCWVL